MKKQGNPKQQGSGNERVYFCPDVLLSHIPHDLRPETVPVPRKPDGAELQNWGPGKAFPPHPATAEPGFDQLLTPGFGHATANRQPGRAKVRVLHPLGMRAEVVELSI